MAVILDVMILSKDYNFKTAISNTRGRRIHQGTYSGNTQNTLHFKQLRFTVKSMFRKGHFVKIWITVLINKKSQTLICCSCTHSAHA